MKIHTRYRFLLVSALNYFFGNMLFLLLWLGLKEFLEYWVIAILCTFGASIFSFQTQSRLTFRMIPAKTWVTIEYLILQFFSLTLGVVLVPWVSSELKCPLVVIQFVWSGLFSLLSVLYLNLLKTKKA